jgi:predicted Fe-Mo cluster-binding NifX family protein
MRIAIPVTDGKLSSHFGHCEQFAIFDTDADSQKIKGQQWLTPPPHEPGLLPSWLSEQGVELVIVGGMGRRAQQLFIQNQIEVIVGAPVDSPEHLISSYLSKTLQTGKNICDH